MLYNTTLYTANNTVHIRTLRHRYEGPGLPLRPPAAGQGGGPGPGHQSGYIDTTGADMQGGGRRAGEY